MVRLSRPPRLGDSDGPRATRIEVLLNGKESHMLDVNPDPLAKTILTLEKPTRMRTLEIRILEASNRVVGTDSVGFAEIELQ